jgi:hypothetical protein
MRRANELIRRGSETDNKTLALRALPFYHRMLRNPDPKVALAAQDRIVQLRGLEAPKIVRNQQLGADGQSADPTTPPTIVNVIIADNHRGDRQPGNWPRVGQG